MAAFSSHTAGAGESVSCTIWLVGVSKNRGGPPKWMVYKGKPENPIKMDDLRVPLFLER